MHVHSHSFAVNDTVIGEVAAVKYLGHIIDNNMTYDADMMRQRRDRDIYIRQSYQGDFICAPLRRKMHCFARSVHRCILASYGGISLYKVCIN